MCTFSLIFEGIKDSGLAQIRTVFADKYRHPPFIIILLKIFSMAVIFYVNNMSQFYDNSGHPQCSRILPDLRFRFPELQKVCECKAQKITKKEKRLW